MLEEVTVVLVEELRHDLIVRILLRVFFILVNERVLKKEVRTSAKVTLHFVKMFALASYQGKGSFEYQQLYRF